MEQLNVNSMSGQKAVMNSLVFGTNWLVHNNSVVGMNECTATELSSNFPVPSRYLDSNRDNYSFVPGFPASHDGENTGNDLKRKRLQQSTAAVSEVNAHEHQIVSPTLTRQDSCALLPVAKVPRLDVNREDLMQQRLYQILLAQDLMQLQNQNMQLQALIQQQRQQNYLEQQILQSVPLVPHFKQIHGLQNEDKLRHLVQYQESPLHISPISSLPVGTSSRLVMQYLYLLRNRPQDNNIGYWRKLISEYYAPGAKIRWCFSLYRNLRKHGHGGFSHTWKEGWTCDVCGSGSGEGFEANFEILPRLFQNNFGGDLVDEILFLEMPQEHKIPSGFLMLQYGKAVLKSVYKQGCVVREGKIRILFRQDMKILSWEFCARKHEEFLVRHQVSSQVSQLVEAAEKCHAVDIASVEDFKSNCNKFAAAGHKLARTIELPLLNGLGLPNTYVRCLQIADVFNNIGDLMAFSAHKKMGPLEYFNFYAQEESSKATQTREQSATLRGQSTRQNNLMTESFSPSSGSKDNHFINDRALQSEKEVIMTRSDKIVDKHTLSSSPRRMIKQETQCLGDQMAGSRITSRVQIPQFADSWGRMANSATAIRSAGIPKAPHSSNSPSCPILPEIKKEPHFF